MEIVEEDVENIENVGRNALPTYVYKDSNGCAYVTMNLNGTCDENNSGTGQEINPSVGPVVLAEKIKISPSRLGHVEVSIISGDSVIVMDLFPNELREVIRALESVEQYTTDVGKLTSILKEAVR